MTNKLLIFSHSSTLSINRVVYRNLLSKFDKISIIVPSLKNIEEENSSIEIIKSDLFFKTKSRLWFLIGLKKILNDNLPTHVIIENEPFSILGIQFCLYKKKYNFKLSFASLDHHCFTNKKLLFFFKYLIFIFPSLYLNRKIDIIFCFSNLIYRFNNNFFSDHKLIKTPLGYPEKIFYPNKDHYSNRNNYNIDNDTTLIGYFGRISPEKGLYDLLFSLVNLHKYKWALLCDSFDEQNDYNNLIKDTIKKNNLQDRVININSSHENLVKYINMCNLIVMPSRWEEQYGRVAAEAMACGKKVIVTNSASLVEITNIHGIIVSKNDLSSLTTQIKKYLINKDKFKIFDEKIAEYSLSNLSSIKQSNIIINSLK